MNTKNTAGPWTIQSYNSGMICIDGGKETICALGYNNSERPDIANARLIAAAPDLLLICRRLKSFNIHTSILSTGILDDLDNVINKAEGK